MQSLAFVVMLTISALAQATGQFRREPYVLSRAIDVLNQPGAPVELRSATLNFGSPGRALVMLRLRTSERSNVLLSGVVLRLGAGPFENGIITFRLRLTSRPSMTDLTTLDGWGFAVFEPLQDDIPPDSLSIRRDTKVLVTVEKITDAVGRLVYNAPDSRELLWKKLAPPLPPRW